jgi:GAF domain-containing protein
MFEPFKITGKREEDYSSLIKALTYLVQDETDRIAVLANASALLNWYLNDINWLGFYLFNRKENLLILGPFQGLPACVRITPGKGVCGTAFETAETQIVGDVLSFPGHIACDSASRSELVIPLIQDAEVLGVLDIDSPLLDRFDKIDAFWLEQAAELIAELL